MDAAQLEKHDRYLSEIFHGKRMLVSGATGLLGARVTAYLDHLNSTQNTGITVIALYRSEQKKNVLRDLLKQPENVIFVSCDVEECIAYEGSADCVIHCAGVSGGSRLHLKDPVKVFDIGIGGTRNLLDYAVTHGCESFLYVSTYEVYGDDSSAEDIPETAACPLDTCVLRNSYAEIKRLCESMLCAFAYKYGIKTSAVRLTSTFGSGVRYDDPRFFAEFSRCILENRDIVLKSHGATVRSYLDADDAAIAFLYVLANGSSCNVYNLTNPENEISILEIAQRMIRLRGSSVRIRIEAAEDVSGLGLRKEGRTVMDTKKIQSLGWRPVYSLDDTLTKLIGAMEKEGMKKGGCT